jgi:N-acetylglucosamine-6-phosphate deacetylase
MTSLEIVGGVVLVDSDCVAARVLIDGSFIADVGAGDRERAREIVDATGCSVLPGFVDLQVNGAVGVDLTSQPDRIGEVAAFLVQCGVTSFMPTVISSSASDVAEALAAMGKWSQEGQPGARSLGVHLEGPFLNPARAGAHPLHHLRPPSVAEVQSWGIETGVAMVTLAPELPKALGVIEWLAANGVSVCAGHTDAGTAEMQAAVSAGVRGVTHLFNAMTPMTARSPGPAGTTLGDSDLIAGLIVDGLHVDPVMVRLAWQALGPNRLALVSDAISALGLPHGAYSVGDTPVVVDERGARTAAGVLAGSVLRFDEAVRNLMAFTGCGLTEASLSASATPARLAQRDDIGHLVPGYLADIVVLDEDNHVVVTVVGGRVVFDPQQRCMSQ